MLKTKPNIAYIDGANLHRAIKELPWRFGYGRFRIWLEDKYNVKQAYIFVGFIPKYVKLYLELWNMGYELVFKEVIFSSCNSVKGNCDSDIVVKAMIDFFENTFQRAVLVSSDGDYAPLIKYLLKENKLEAIVSPHSPKECSILLKKTGAKISYIFEQKNVLEAK